MVEEAEGRKVVVHEGRRLSPLLLQLNEKKSGGRSFLFIPTCLSSSNV